MARVLWLSAETPDRHGQGGQRRQFHQIRELVEFGHDMTVWTLSGAQNDASLRDVARVERIRVTVAGRYVDWFRKLLHRRVAAGHWDAVVVAHGESLWMLPGVSGTPVLVDIHNVMSDWHLRRGMALEARQWRDREATMIARVDAVSVCSAEERRRLIRRHPDIDAPVIIAPLGIDPAEWPEVPWRRTHPVVALFGSWGWHPNARGLEWFRTEVWPEVRRSVPDARAVVAGSGADHGDWPDGMTFVGRVDSLAEFTADAAVVAVPVFEGVGASVKFAEALATGAVVVATIDAANAATAPPAIVSDDPRVWIESLVAALRGRAQLVVPDPAREFALTSCTWRAAALPIHEWLARVSSADASPR